MRSVKFSVLIILFSSLNIFSQSSNSFFGVQTHFGQFYRSDMDSANMIKMLDSVKAAGIKFIRDECYWSEVEKSRGVYIFPKQIDDYVNAASSRGIKILLILNYNNPLYAPHAGSAVITDSNRAAFAKYCQQAVARYSPLGIKHYEIWNEPNIPMFWDPTPNAVDYVKLLQAAYSAIKQIDSSVIVMGCATSPAEGNPSPFINWLTFINQVFANGGGSYMDAVSFHLYRVDRRPELWLNSDINDLRTIIGSTKPIWLTEVGYHTSSVGPNLTLQQQANYVARHFLLGKSIGKLENITYYDLKNDGEIITEPEHNFGLMNFNLSPKPAFTSLKTLISQIDGKELIAQSKFGENYKFTFSGSGETTLAFWNSSSTYTKNEMFGKNRIRIVASSGETYYLYDKDKIVEVTYTEEPKYHTELNSLPAINRLELLPKIDSIVVGQKFNLKLIGYTNDAKKIYIDSSAVIWNTISSFVKIDSNGTLTALGTGIATIIAEFEGYVTTKDIVILPSYSYLEIEPFNSLSRFSVSYLNQLPSTNVSIIDTNYTSPLNSLKIDYAFQYKGIDQHRVIFDCDYALLGEPDSLLIDIFNNGNGHVFEFQIEDRDAEIFRSNTLPLLASFGWKTARALLISFGLRYDMPARLKRIILYTVKNSGQVDSVYSGSIQHK